KEEVLVAANRDRRQSGKVLGLGDSDCQSCLARPLPADARVGIGRLSDVDELGKAIDVIWNDRDVLWRDGTLCLGRKRPRLCRRAWRAFEIGARASRDEKKDEGGSDHAAARSAIASMCDRSSSSDSRRRPSEASGVAAGGLNAGRGACVAID